MNRRIPVLSLCLVSVCLAALPAEPAAALASCQYTYNFMKQSAWAHLDHDLFGFAADRPVTITDSNGYTANAGLGAKYYLSDNFFVDFDARYRYLSKLTSDYGKGINTVVTTLSLGFQF